MKKLSLLVPVFITLLISIANANMPTPNIFISITTDKPVYKSKEPLAIALTILNQGTEPYQAVFSSGKTYDFYFYQDDQLLGKWSNNKMFSQAIRNITLEPHQPLTYVVTFNQILASGQSLEPGKYRIIGALCTRGKEFLSSPVEIESK